MDIASLERAKAPYNPRKIEGENLAKLVHSLETYGQVENIILNKRTGNIVSGHQRIEAAKHAGIPRLTVLEIDITESKEKALNIALNNSRLQGEWDMPKLEIVMHDIIQAPDIDIEDTGFDLEDYEVIRKIGRGKYSEVRFYHNV